MKNGEEERRKNVIIKFSEFYWWRKNMTLKGRNERAKIERAKRDRKDKLQDLWLKRLILPAVTIVNRDHNTLIYVVYR